MKIIHVVHNYYGFSGASLQAKNLAKEIDIEGGVKQIFVTRKNNIYHESDKYGFLGEDGVVHIPNGLSRIIYFYSLCLKFKPDIVHFHGADFGLLFVCALLKIKVYWKSTLLGSDDFSSLINSRGGMIKRFLLRFISVNNTLSEQIYIINRKYLPSEKLITIPNGVSILDDAIIDRKEKIALIISAIIPRKNIIEGILFFKKNLEGKGYKLIIVGPSGDDIEGYNGEYAEKCMSFLNDNIIYKGYIAHSEVTSLLISANFLIHLSEKEGMPNVVLEALAFGVYPIVGPMGGLASEIITSEDIGFIISNASFFIVEKHEGVNSLGMELINEKYTFKVISRKTRHVYNSLKGL